MKSVVMFIIGLGVLLMMGCSSSDSEKKQSSVTPAGNGLFSSSPTIDPSPTPTQTATADVVNTAAPLTVKLGTKSFAEIVPTTFFPIDQNTTRVDTSRKDSGNSIVYSASTSIDLNGDQKPDKLSMMLISDASETSTLSVNGLSFSRNFDAPTGSIHIVDLNTHDTFKEIAISDDGPSGDPTQYIYRYTGKEILELGRIHDTVKIDGKGKLLSTWNMSHFSPEIPFCWYEIERDHFVKQVTHLTDGMDKPYTMLRDMEAYFKELPAVPGSFTPDFGGKIPMTILPSGSTLTLHKISLMDEVPMWYYVTLPDGKKGVLYFWMGD